MVFSIIALITIILNKTRFSITTLSITKFRITTPNIMTLSITTLSSTFKITMKVALRITLLVCGVFWAHCRYAECHGC